MARIAALGKAAPVFSCHADAAGESARKTRPLRSPAHSTVGLAGSTVRTLSGFHPLSSAASVSTSLIGVHSPSSTDWYTRLVAAYLVDAASGSNANGRLSQPTSSVSRFSPVVQGTWLRPPSMLRRRSPLTYWKKHSAVFVGLTSKMPPSPP